MSGDLAKLLEVLGRDPAERLSLNGLVDGRFRSLVVTVSAAARWDSSDIDCWYGTAALHPRVTDGRGYAKDVIGVRELFADLDIKPGGMPDTEAASQVIDTLAGMLGAAPAAVVNSGHGLQPHWPLEHGHGTNWDDETDDRWMQAVVLWRRWGRLVATVAERYGGRVDNVYDLSRILRVPGTTNTKTDPVPVTVSWAPAVPVSLDRLADTLDEYGIDELDGDRDTLGETVAPPADWIHGDHTCSYVTSMVAGWGDDTPTARHPWLVSQSVRLATAHRLGCLTGLDHQAAVQRLTERFTRLATKTGDCRAVQPGEIPDALSWGVAKAATFTEERAHRELGDHHRPQPVGAPPAKAHDDETFWTARDELKHIRTYAQAQMACPLAVLSMVLARVVCQAPVAIVLPDIIHDHASLNLTIALVGVSGGGKGGATAVARRAVDIGTENFDTHTLGSGQGIAHGYGHWDKNTKTVERHADSVLFTVEEVDHIAGHNAQNGSTTLAEQRRFSMGEKLGHLYVDPTRRVQIGAHTYRGAVVVSVQPARASVLLDAAEGGTPQRFWWVPTIDTNPPDTEPDQPEPWHWQPPSSVDLPPVELSTGLRPIPVCETARTAIRDAQRARNRGEGDPLDGHALLTRERIAAALGLLNGHYGITDEDWDLAGQAMAISDATRASVVAELEAKARTANLGRAHQEADRDEVKEDRQDQRVGHRVLRTLQRQGGDWVTWGELNRQVGGRDRPALSSAIAKLLAAGVIEDEPTQNQGPTSVRYRVKP